MYLINPRGSKERGKFFLFQFFDMGKMEEKRYKESEIIMSSLLRVLAGLGWVFTALFIGNALLVTDYKDTHRNILVRYDHMVSNNTDAQSILEAIDVAPTDEAVQATKSDDICKNQDRPHGSEPLPKGIVTATSDLEMRALWGHQKKNPKNQTNLLALAVGINQKEGVDKIVRKFFSSGFVIMLFHYDGNVDAWKGFDWSDQCIHISAEGQTKWWFAKRFLHPDIVSDYEYIFLWDEDLGVEHFNAGRYLSIIEEEGLHISQPALGPNSTEVHHWLTVRNPGHRVHRRVYGGRKCREDSKGPPCAGYVEMMAPVFSKASWRCAWYMFQNDLVYGWGVDFLLGYCAQGKRTENVGIVDSEYVVHYGVPSLGGGLTSDKTQPYRKTARARVRKWSFHELHMFIDRWNNAVKNDKCWIDPYN